MSKDPEYDLFISHASEDKGFVQPLVEALGHLAVKVWYDVLNLTAGDDLSRSIDQGLLRSRRGLVLLSKNFFKKKWTNYELRGLINREMGQEEKVIFPVWHGVTYDDVLEFSPSLAGRYALDTSKMPIEELTLAIVREVRPDIYNQHPRVELDRIMRGEALQALKEQLGQLEEELAETKEELGEFQCPTCGAPATHMGSVDLDEHSSGSYQSFACGYSSSHGPGVDRPCPSDPKFPKFEDYEPILTQERDGQWFWPRRGENG